MSYDFDRVVPRTNTCSMKYDDPGFFHAMNPNIRLDEDTIRIMLADMDFQCAPAITKAMHHVADTPSFGYVTLTSNPAFLPSIVHWYKKRFGFAVNEKDIVFAGSALGAVEQAILAFSQPGDGVILCYPGYSHFRSSVQKLGRKIAACDFLNDGEGHYTMDWAGFEALCAAPENKVHILCSPHNPLGIVWAKEDLVRMAEICRKNNVLLVSDEIHCDFVRAGKKHLPILSVADTSNLILVGGANKSFNLMGLHCAYAIIPDEGLRQKFCANYEVAATAFTLAALVAAYEESEDWLNSLNAYLDESLAIAVEYLHAHFPKAKAHIPDGTYILWVDFSAYHLGNAEMMRRINHMANVCVSDGSSCDPNHGAECVRLCMTCPHSQLKEALARMAKAFEDIG